ncbi:MAG: sulfotransferase [Planctomycetota bacterium]
MARKPLYFLVGVGRSGTTLFQRLMDAHPRLGLTDEAGVQDLLFFFTQIARIPAWQPMTVNRGTKVELHGYVHPSLTDEIASMVTVHAIDMLYEFYERRFEGRDVEYFGDKLPDPEAVVTMNSVLDGLRAALLVRDPRDVLCSMRSFGSRDNIRKGNRFFVDNSAEQFATHWNNLYAGFPELVEGTRIVRYEDMIQRPIEEASDTFRWLGLDPADADQQLQRERAEFSAHGTSASSEQSVERWRRDLSDEDLASIEATCGETMRRYGYETA